MREEILAFLKRATKRAQGRHFIVYMIQGLMISLIVSLIFLIVSMWVTIPYANEKAIIIVVAGLIISGIYSMVRMPNKKQVALMVDQTGLKERLSTAFMLIDNDEPFSQLQREDTLIHIRNYNLKEHFPFHYSVKKIGINVMLIIACGVVCHIPTAAKQKENDLRQFQKQKQELVQQVEEQKKKLDQVEELSTLTKEEIANMLEKTKEEIPKAQEEEDIKKAMERLDKKLDNLSKEKEAKEQEAINKLSQNLTEPFQKQAQQEAQDDMKTLSETLNQNEWTKELAEGLEQDIEDDAIDEALEDLQKQIDQMSETEKQALADTLSQLGENLNSTQLVNQFSQASSSIANGTLNSQNLKLALKALKKTAYGSSKESAGENGQGSGESGDGSGNGGNSGNGSGSGSGEGKGGTGWNMGSTKGKEEESTGNKAEDIPELTQGKEENLSGEMGDDSSIDQIEISHGINIAGQKVDYRSVVGDYTEEALENIEQRPVPEHMKEAIQEYFEAINQ